MNNCIHRILKSLPELNQWIEPMKNANSHYFIVLIDRINEKDKIPPINAMQINIFVILILTLTWSIQSIRIHVNISINIENPTFRSFRNCFDVYRMQQYKQYF